MARRAPPQAGTIAARIHLAMQARHIQSPNTLAGLIGVGRATVHRWLTEDADSIHPRLLFKVADALSYNPRWLATGEGNPAPPVEASKDALEAADVWRNLSDEGREAWIRQGRDLAQLAPRHSRTLPVPNFPVKPRK